MSKDKKSNRGGRNAVFFKKEDSKKQAKPLLCVISLADVEVLYQVTWIPKEGEIDALRH